MRFPPWRHSVGGASTVILSSALVVAGVFGRVVLLIVGCVGLGGGVVWLVASVRHERRTPRDPLAQFISDRTVAAMTLRESILSATPDLAAWEHWVGAVRQWRDATRDGLEHLAPATIGSFLAYHEHPQKSYNKGVLDDPLCQLDDHLAQLGKIRC